MPSGHGSALLLRSDGRVRSAVRPSGHGSASSPAYPAPVTVRRRLDAELVRRGVAREPPPGGRGDRRRTRAASAAARAQAPARLVGAGEPIQVTGDRAALRVARRREARGRARPLRGRRARASGPRRRRVDRRVHRLPAPARRRARRTRSTSAGASSRGRCATTRASPCWSAPTSATSNPPTSAARSTSPSPTSRSSRCVTVAPALAALHATRRRPRAAGEAAVRSRTGAGRQGRESCATPACTGRCSARCATACATPASDVVDVMASPLRGADGNVEFLVHVRRTAARRSTTPPSTRRCRGRTERREPCAPGRSRPAPDRAQPRPSWPRTPPTRLAAHGIEVRCPEPTRRPARRSLDHRQGSTS